MKRAVFLLLALLLSGCAGRGLSGSFCGPLPSDTAVVQVAQDAVSFLASSYPPGHTALFLMPAKAENAFAHALENGLRSRGFTLLMEDRKDALAVAYTLDELRDDAAWYLQLRLSDGKALARVYDAAGLPEAGRSQTEAVAPRPLLEKAANKAGAAYDKAAHALTA